MPDLSRQEFMAVLGHELRAGDHVSAIGPTGRGKSTAIGQLVPYCSAIDVVAILSPKGRDEAYAHLGRPTAVWPPRLPWQERLRMLAGDTDDRDERQKIWRIEVPIKTDADFARMAAVYRAALASVYKRKEKPKQSLMVVVDDSRFVCDPKMLNLSKTVTAALILGRSKRVTIVNNFQAPRWVPREGLDQITHALLWRNRDTDVAKRLAEVSGTIDPKVLMGTIAGLGYHEFVWVNGRRDEWLVVGS